jgi:hypothetical protein
MPVQHIFDGGIFEASVNKLATLHNTIRMHISGNPTFFF